MKHFLHLALLGFATLVAALPASVSSIDVALPVTESSINLTSINTPRNIASCAGRSGNGKRGVAYNNPSYTRYFKTGNSKVNWMYNWDSDTPTSTTPDTGFEYVPMLWDNTYEHNREWFAHIDRHVTVFCGYYAMSFNEPDNCDGTGGSCIPDVNVAIAAYRQWMQPLADKYPQIKLGAPAVTNDNNNGKGLVWMKKFIDGCTGCKIDFVAVHWYDQWWNTAYFKNHIEQAHRDSGGRPIWITEFAPTDGDEGQKIDFLHQVLPWLDDPAQSYVNRYAYQMAKTGSLIKLDGSGLSAIGDVFNGY